MSFKLPELSVLITFLDTLENTYLLQDDVNILVSIAKTCKEKKHVIHAVFTYVLLYSYKKKYSKRDTHHTLRFYQKNLIELLNQAPCNSKKIFFQSTQGKFNQPLELKEDDTWIDVALHYKQKLLMHYLIRCSESHQAYITRQINKEANDDIIEIERDTVLHLLCCSGITDLSLYQQFIKKWPQALRARTPNFHLPLHKAACFADKDVFEYLFEETKKEWVRTDSKRNTLLHLAAECANTEVVKLLLKQEEVSVNALNNDKRTPLHCAAAAPQLNEGSTLADYAAVFNALLVPGAELMHKDSNEETADDIASKNEALYEQFKKALDCTKLKRLWHDWQTEMVSHYTKEKFVKRQLFSEEYFSLADHFMNLQMIMNTYRQETTSPSHQKIKLDDLFQPSMYQNSNGEPLQSVDTIVVSGVAGVGKTTLAEYLAYQWASSKQQKSETGLWSTFNAVLIVRCCDLSSMEKLGSGLDAIINLLHRYCFGSLRIQHDEVKLLLQNLERSSTKCLLLLDGLDELPISKKKYWCDLLKQLFQLPFKKLVLTRPLEAGKLVRIQYDGLIEIKGFSDDDVPKFFKKILGNSDKTNDFIKELQQNKDLWEITRIPIHAYLLKVFWKEYCKERKRKQSPQFSEIDWYYFLQEAMSRHTNTREIRLLDALKYWRPKALGKEANADNSKDNLGGFIPEEMNRNMFFGRKDDMNKLIDNMNKAWQESVFGNSSPPLIEINGLSGIGKTTLIKTFIHRNNREKRLFPDGEERLTYDYIAWINAKTKMKSYEHLLDDFKIEDKKQSDEHDKIRAVNDELIKKERVLLVIDDATPEQLKEFSISKFPSDKERYIHYIITTCHNPTISNPNYRNVNKIVSIELTSINIEESSESEEIIKHIKNKLNVPERRENKISNEHIKKLISALGGLHEAIIHAIHYLCNNDRETTIKDYINRLQSNEEEFLKQFNEMKRDVSEEHKHIFAAWQLSLESLVDKKYAKRILGYCSYLEPSCIEKNFLLECMNINKENKRNKITNALALLHSCSFLSRNNSSNDNYAISMHPLLQMFIRDFIVKTNSSDKNTIDRYYRKKIKIIRKIVKIVIQKIAPDKNKDEPKNITELNKLLSHGIQAISLTNKDGLFVGEETLSMILSDNKKVKICLSTIIIMILLVAFSGTVVFLEEEVDMNSENLIWFFTWMLILNGCLLLGGGLQIFLASRCAKNDYCRFCCHDVSLDYNGHFDFRPYSTFLIPILAIFFFGIFAYKKFPSHILKNILFLCLSTLLGFFIANIITLPNFVKSILKDTRGIYIDLAKQTDRFGVLLYKSKKFKEATETFSKGRKLLREKATIHEDSIDLLESLYEHATWPLLDKGEENQKKIIGRKVHAIKIREFWNNNKSIYKGEPPENFFKNYKNAQSKETSTRNSLTANETNSAENVRCNANSSNDNHWYEDEEMNLLLQYYISKNQEVTILDAVLGTNYENNNFLRTKLIEFHKKRYQEITQSHTNKNKVLIPVNLNNNHWTLLYIIYQGNTDQLPEVSYFDPLGNDIPEDITNALSDENLYPEITPTPIGSGEPVQNDSYNCGPWVIEAAKKIIQGQENLIGGCNIAMARNEHQCILSLEGKSLSRYLKLHDNRVFGKCLYRAVNTTDNTTYHNKTINYLKEHREILLENFWGGTEQSFNNYITEANKNDTWADALEIYALATILERTIIIIPEESSKPVFIFNKKAKESENEPLYLFYKYKKYYQELVPISEREEDAYNQCKSKLNNGNLNRNLKFHYDEVIMKDHDCPHQITIWLSSEEFSNKFNNTDQVNNTDQERLEEVYVDHDQTDEEGIDIVSAETHAKNQPFSVNTSVNEYSLLMDENSKAKSKCYIF